MQIYDNWIRRAYLQKRSWREMFFLIGSVFACCFYLFLVFAPRG